MSLIEAIDTHQASTWIGIDALPSRLSLLASEQDGDLPTGAVALSRISKIWAITVAEG